MARPRRRGVWVPAAREAVEGRPGVHPRSRCPRVALAPRWSPSRVPAHRRRFGWLASHPPSASAAVRARRAPEVRAGLGTCSPLAGLSAPRAYAGGLVPRVGGKNPRCRNWLRTSCGCTISLLLDLSKSSPTTNGIPSSDTTNEAMDPFHACSILKQLKTMYDEGQLTDIVVEVDHGKTFL